MSRHFTRSFTQQVELPEQAFQAAQAVLQSAGLHRYQAADQGLGEAAQLEAEYAAWQGQNYCLALASGGQAIQLALRACGVTHGDQVLTNAFTLAPVPGAIFAVRGQPVLVDTTVDLVIDLEDLERKIAQADARVLLLSHMRGYIADMDALMSITAQAGITVIEDCAHTMGATWRGIKSGNFGAVGCFSTQTYKHINSGEGGLLTTNDPKIAARATIMSGSYMNYERHGASPAAEHFEDVKYDCANMSARMDNLRAAILRPQLAELNVAIKGWALRHDLVRHKLKSAAPFVQLPECLTDALRVGSSLQFSTPSLTGDGCLNLMAALLERGVEVKWFGRNEPHGFTSQHSHWRYVAAQDVPQTDRVLSTLFDMRIPLSFSEQDCHTLGDIMCDVIETIAAEQ